MDRRETRRDRGRQTLPANRTDLNAWPSGAAVAGISVASTHPMLARPQLGQEQEGAREGGTAEVTADFFHPDKWRARHFLPKERGGGCWQGPIHCVGQRQNASEMSVWHVQRGAGREGGDNCAEEDGGEYERVPRPMSV